MRFSGIYEHQMDEKGRVSIPVEVRRSLGDESLFFYDRRDDRLGYFLPGDVVKEGLERSAQRLQERPTNPLNGDFCLDDVLKAADAQLNLCRLTWDKNGRAVIPEQQRKGNGRQKVSIAGVGNYLVFFWGSNAEFQDYIHLKVHLPLDPSQG